VSVPRALRGWQVLRCAASHWASDRATTLGAALAFYSAFSLAPLLVVLVTITGWIVGAETATRQLAAQLSALFGAGLALPLVAAMKSSQTAGGLWATAVSVVTLLLGASTVFSALDAALQRVWGTARLAPRGFRGFLRARILSFGLILAIGFLLLVSLTVSIALAALRGYLVKYYTGYVVLTAVLDFAISVTLVACLIAAIYRFLPARRIAWRPILLGALLTALLFQLGRWAIGFYLARSTQPSAFGAAASFAALLLWLYYTAQIFLFGAEFTACLGGSRAGVRAESERPALKEAA
jgi:membrane protein